MNISTINSPAAAVPSAPVYSGGERVVVQESVGQPVAQPSPSPTSVPDLGYQGQGQGSAAEMSDEELAKVMEEPVKQANKVLSGYDRQIEREVHAVTKTMMYKIRDTKTNEVIAEYPPKKIQDMIAKMWELAGLFIDQKA
jgi:uncharacterized FlaG/YvyC family protein